MCIVQRCILELRDTNLNEDGRFPAQSRLSSVLICAPLLGFMHRVIPHTAGCCSSQRGIGQSFHSLMLCVLFCCAVLCCCKYTVCTVLYCNLVSSLSTLVGMLSIRLIKDGSCCITMSYFVYSYSNSPFVSNCAVSTSFSIHTYNHCSINRSAGIPRRTCLLGFLWSLRLFKSLAVNRCRPSVGSRLPALHVKAGALMQSLSQCQRHPIHSPR
jgi:hypothetical protein